MVTEERRIAAPRSVVWQLATDPAHHRLLSPKCRLLSSTGVPGEVGAECVDAVWFGPFRFRLRSKVVAATAGEEITSEHWRGRTRAGVQRGELLDDGNGVLLRWTVTLFSGGLSPSKTEETCRAELVRWLAAIEREALAS